VIEADVHRFTQKKKDRIIKNWKERFFIIRDNFLCYYASEKEDEQFLKGKIYIDKESIVQNLSATKFMLITKNRRILLEAKSKNDKEDWIVTLNDVATIGRLVVKGSVVLGHEENPEINVKKKLKNMRIVLGEDTPEKEIEDAGNAVDMISPECISNLYFSDIGEGDTLKIIITCLSFKHPDLKDKFFDSVSKLSGLGKYGQVHTALQIGDTILEWNDSSLVSMADSKDFCQTHSVCALDVLEDPDDHYITPSQLAKVCFTIAKYNGLKEYDKIFCNCQHFTSEILKALDIPDPINQTSNPKVKSFLDQVCNIDRSTLHFSFLFPGDKTPTPLLSHAALDEECFKRESKLRPGSEDYRILKAMDRVFWLRYYGAAESLRESLEDPKSKKVSFFEDLNEMYKPWDTCCFFQDPGFTRTNWRRTSKPKKTNFGINTFTSSI